MNPKGNPEFGTKYKFNYGRNKPFASSITTRVPQETELQLKEIADKDNCSIPDLIREAINLYLAKRNSLKLP